MKCFKLNLLLFFVGLCVAQVAMADTLNAELLQKLRSLPGVVEADTMQSLYYPHKFVLYMRQPLDVDNPEAGSFKQRIIVAHAGYDRPTVLVTEGYDAGYAITPYYQEELSRLLNANLVFVEHRYFGKSVPDSCDWDYLTMRNELNDLHRIRTVFGTLYTRKWVATGISKGGQTAMSYRAFFPDDVDVTVPYVAPLNYSEEDKRHGAFLSERISSFANRKKVKTAQLELLKRKSDLLPLFKSYCEEKKYTFRIPLEDIYDFCVLEYAFALWQWGTPLTDIPLQRASDEVWFRHFVEISEPGYFSRETPYTPFNVQAVRELGYYAYDIRPFRKYLSLKTTKNYLQRVMLPEELSYLKFDASLMKRMVEYLKKHDPKMIYIYGGADPWVASGVTWLKGKKFIHVYVLPGGSHTTRISSFDSDTQMEIKKLLLRWLDDSGCNLSGGGGTEIKSQ